MKLIYKTEQTPKNLKELKNILIENRGIKDTNLFFDPAHPSKISLDEVNIDKKEMKAVVDRIKKAKEAEETIVIFGDYDADGICASAILWQAIFDIDCKVVPFIPHREKHGYGISIKAIDEIITAHSPSLIITVDNGIVAHEPIQYLRDKGIDVVLTDHHTPEFKDDEIDLPNANHVLHSTKLCGATVAWMLAREIDEKAALKSLDLCAIATVADQVTLTEANRSFAKFGLEELRDTRRLGLTTLFDKLNIKQLEINGGNVGYTIAPQINAMGRLEHGLEALRLLCTKNKKQADKLAQLLNETNLKRRALTFDLLDHANKQVSAIEDEHIIIVYSDHYHEGILGLIAGGLMERFHKPAIAISLGEKTAKASARSVSGVNIVELLREIKGDLLAVGGHPMAAGFGFESDKLEVITDKLFKIGREKIPVEKLVKAVRVETNLPVALVSDEMVEMVESFKPFGKGNPRPIFNIDKMSVLELATMGKENNHLRLSLGSQKDIKNDGDFQPFKAIGWRMAPVSENIDTGDTVSIIGHFEFNIWRDRKSIQMFIKDIEKTN